MNLVFVWECHRLQGKKKLSCGTKTILNAPVDWRVKGFRDAGTRGGGDAETQIRQGLRPRLISGDQIKDLDGA